MRGEKNWFLAHQDGFKGFWVAKSIGKPEPGDA